eukprot:2075606-Pleurochrysis_carterae.AAC.1
MSALRFFFPPLTLPPVVRIPAWLACASALDTPISLAATLQSSVAFVRIWSRLAALPEPSSQRHRNHLTLARFSADSVLDTCTTPLSDSACVIAASSVAAAAAWLVTRTVANAASATLRQIEADLADLLHQGGKDTTYTSPALPSSPHI